MRPFVCWPVIVGCLVAAPRPPVCICTVAKIHGGWCEACKVGYVASLKIESWMLYETLDNHGHDIDPKIIPCESCKKAVEVDGFCDACRIGYVGKQSYFIPLTYYVAKGEAKDPSQIKCVTCRKSMEGGGWCETCKVGMVGNVAVKDRKGYEEADQAFRRLRLAVSHLKECETCAVAMFMNSLCPKCRITYEDGKPVTASSP